MDDKAVPGRQIPDRDEAIATLFYACYPKLVRTGYSLAGDSVPGSVRSIRAEPHLTGLTVTGSAKYLSVHSPDYVGPLARVPSGFSPRSAATRSSGSA